MTIIVAIPHNGRVYMGGDSAGANSRELEIRVEPKVWIKDDIVFGGTKSFRELQILQYRLAVPRRDDDDIMRWLVVDFIDAIRATRKDAGYDEKGDDGLEVGPQLMVGVAGRLFSIERDYQVYERPDGHAIGCGFQLALGSLHTSSAFWTSPRRRIEAALAAACAASPGCEPPFTVLSA
jgi:hypothetical protein